MSTKKLIITTTINEPTKATKKFKQMTDWDFLVVGDKKTPHNSYKEYNYLSPQDQELINKNLSDMIGWNCIQRRNFGFLYALQNGYDYIATVDDDNIPYDTWGKHWFNNGPSHIESYSTHFNFFDPLSVTNYSHLWHRGFPLQYVNLKNHVVSTRVPKENFDVQANLWNGDPDIDAVCRMIYKPECYFEMNDKWYTTSNFTPFNSQNTILTKEALKYYFMFNNVGRMDDIFGSYMLQKRGFKVIFGPPTVYQERNDHDLTVDMKKEYIGYENVVDILNNETPFIPMEAYKKYLELSHSFGNF